MNICKKIISTICASVLAFGCLEFNVNAKVIEPEIVKTETWTTSYFIDDDEDTLYPYIQCEADIYNDGTIKLYMWNTHEWDGFATVSHTAKIIQTSPVKQGSELYCFSRGEVYIDPWGTGWKSDRILDEFDVSYYSDKYDFNCYFWPQWTYQSEENFTISGSTGSLGFDVCRNVYNGSLPNMDFGKKTALCYEFRPNEDPTGTYNFRLYGHDITITPELLSGNIVAEPELTEQEKYINQLEVENAALKTELESYKKLDFDGDGLLTVKDAQMILIYYLDYLVGKTTGKVEDYSEYIKNNN